MKKLTLFFIVLQFFTSCKEKTLFTLQQDTRIDFANNLTETEQDNILDYEYFYNGGGVGAGDFNNDGLIDLFFTGNQVENALYLNKGSLTFENISHQAHLNKPKGTWATGVSLVDINADGWLDIYVCYSGLREATLRKNQLFINRGLKNNLPVFEEQAEAYGLADSGYSTQATFFDYDEDGDLDCFLINHNLEGYERKEAHIMRAAYDYNAGDKLFRNDGIKGTNMYPTFTEVTLEAGIKANPLGFGLGVSISDVNGDGLTDIYVANDFVEDDYLYINQGNGKFKDELRKYIEHTSYSSMGVDIADLNNDLLPDIFTTDMLPEDNARQKLLVWPDNWNVYQAQLQNGFWHANMRNMLQLNNGNSTFSEVGQLAGIANTDWSWAVLLYDFDLDKYKDVFISNGIGRDFTNIDFIKYSTEMNRPKLSLLEELKKLTHSQTKNYIFRNNGNATFSNSQKQWGFDNITISNGTVAADLDNDGDLEIVTNNLNETARIYKNNTQEIAPKTYIKLKLKGKNGNLNGIGAKIIIKEGDRVGQLLEVNPTKGYLSSTLDTPIFAADSSNTTVEVYWPNGEYQQLKPQPNQLTVIDQAAAAKKEITRNENQTYFALDSSFIKHNSEIGYSNDFDRQLLLPQHYSYFGPELCKADINNDGIDDLIVAGNLKTPTTLFLGNSSGNLIKNTTTNFGKKSVQQIKVADFNGDKFLDLYFAVGNYGIYDPYFQNDELWLNDGKGNFLEKIDINDGINNKTAFINDFNRDGQLDVFLGGFIKPLTYPIAEPSLLLLRNADGKFIKNKLAFNGLITAIQSINANELLVVGEWMPPTVLVWQNNNLVQQQKGIPADLEGWWNCIRKADLDNDGDDDFVLGNMGKNVQFGADIQHPASLVFADFDGNGSIDPFMEHYIQGTAYPPYSRDEVTEQIPILRRKFQTYSMFSTAILSDFFDKNEIEKADKRQIKELETIILEQADGKFVVHKLPIEAQYSSVFDVLLTDINHDQKKDIILVGNNSKMRLRMGKIDANFGQLFINKANWTFEYIPQWKSGLAIKGDARSCIEMNNRIFVGINNAPLAVYKLVK